MEGEDWFVNPWKEEYKSAAGPLVTLMQIHFGGPKVVDDPIHDFFKVVVLATNLLDPSIAARIALDRLKDAASLPLRDLAPHIGMLSTLGTELSCSPALLQQHSVKDDIHILLDLISAPYNPETAIEVEACIRPCLIYVLESLSASDGCSFVAEALHGDTVNYLYLTEVLRALSAYTIYPSVLWSFVASIKECQNVSPIPT
ncbi:hypothetical protein B0H19DRAFT_91297 [Mycena capillaripes]|nr:hypothetical protein B0H19DRAFT_91297 [Mycena capillaripes]